MSQAQNPNYLKLSLISISLMGLVTTVHHAFRMGFEVLPPFLIMTLLPFLLMQWYRRSNKKHVLGLYVVWNSLFWLMFAFFDGFLDHVFKAAGLHPVTFLEGSDAAVVETVFKLWSPEAGHLFYEGTGVMTTVVGTFALYFTFRVALSLFAKTPELAYSA